MGRYKVDIPDELWREARAHAIRQNMTISQWVAGSIMGTINVSGGWSEELTVDDVRTIRERVRKPDAKTSR